MLEIIKVLQSTPIPVLLILGGLFFLLLGFVTKIGGVIEVAPEQKKWAIFIGLLILTIGLVIHFTPNTKNGMGDANPSDCQTDQRCWDGLHKVAEKWDVTSAKSYLIKLRKSEDPCTAKFAEVFENELNNKSAEGFRNINSIKRSINQKSNCQLPMKSFDFSP